MECGERIVSLLPSATEVVGALGLLELLVGVSHSCDLAPEKHHLDVLLAAGRCRRVTSTTITPNESSQAVINDAVLESLRAGASLYSVLADEFTAAAPTLVLTQGLCEVCGPSMPHVTSACRLLPSGADGKRDVRVLSLEPRSLSDVADSFVAISEAATGSADLGKRLSASFLADVSAIASLCAAGSNDAAARPRRLRCVMLEWTDPLFDGGHWVPDMMAAAGLHPPTRSPGADSTMIQPEDLEAYNPDFLVVGCCGFGLSRNVSDAEALWEKPWFRALRCVQAGRVFAANGNRYFARPSPSLVGGTAILARCRAQVVAEWGTHATDAEADAALGGFPPLIVPGLVDALEGTGLLPAEGVGWIRVSDPTTNRDNACTPSSSAAGAP